MERVKILVDGIEYSVSKSKAEIAYEGKDPAALHLLLSSDKHRKSVADAASIVHRESEPGGWMSERPDSWSISAGGKSLKVSWDGSMPDSKKESSLAAAVAAIKAAKDKLVKRADDLNQMAMETFNKPIDQLDESQLRQLLQKMQGKVAPTQPAPIAPNPSMTPTNNAPIAPLAPGASSVSVRWMRSAEDDKKAPPFEKKDDKAEDKKDEKDEKKDEGKSEKKDDKKPESKPEKKDDAPKKDKPAPKKDEAPSKSDEKKDVSKADKAIKTLEDLIEREEAEGEGGPHVEALKHALEDLRKFLGEEKEELEKAPADGIPMKVDLPIVKEPLPPAGPVKPAVPMAPKPPMGPKPMPLPMASKEDGFAGFRLGDFVWHKTEAGAEFDPGRIVDFGGGKVIVDWGDSDGVLAEYSPIELVRASSSQDEPNLFAADGGSELSGVVDEEPLADDKSQIETILASMTVSDVLNKKASAGSKNDSAITHIATGRSGEFLANTADGRCLVRIDGEEHFVWPQELRFGGDESLF